MTKYNIDKVLERLELEIDSTSGEERYLRCPFHEDSDPSFSINSRTGLWICFAGCGEGNIVMLVQELLGLNSKEALKWLSGNELEIQSSLLKNKLEKALQTKEQAPDKPSNYWNENMLLPFFKHPMPSYLYDRGFTEDTLKRWKVGYDRKKGEVVIPIFSPDNELLGLVRRSVTKRRYGNSAGLDKSHILFGIDKAVGARKVYVVEGPLDAMWLDQYGYSSVGLLGCNLSDRQAQLLVEYFRVAVFVLDNDEPGRHGAEVARKKLRGRLVFEERRLPEAFNDVQEMDKKELAAILLEGRHGVFTTA